MDMIVFVYLFFLILGYKMLNEFGLFYFYEKEGWGVKVFNNKIF